MTEKRIRIVLDARSAKKNADELNNSVQNVGFSLNKLSAAISGIITAGALVNFFAESAKASIQFEKALSSLSAITGATGNDLKFLSDASRELSRESTKSGVEVANAFKLVASAKPDLLENAEALKSVTREVIALAEAGEIDLVQASNAVGLSLNQFGEDAEEAARYVNILAAGAKFGSSEIFETAEAIKNSGVAAASAGLSFEQANAAIQVLAASGIKAAEAGTSLRNIITILDTNVNQKFRPSVVGLSAALQNLSAEGLESTQMVELFGRENINAGRILSDSASKVDELTAALTGTKTAYEQQKINNDNLDGDLKRLANSYDDLKITVGDLFNANLRSSVQSFAGAIESTANIIPDLIDAAELLAVVIGARLTASIAQYSIASAKKIKENYLSLKSENDLAVGISRRAVAESESAAATLAAARADLSAVNAKVALTAAYATTKKQIEAHNIALAQQQAAQSRVNAAVMASAVATQAANRAQAAVTATAGAMSVATKAAAGLRVAMGFLGGPLGVLMIAASAMVYFTTKAKEQVDVTDILTRSTKDLTDIKRQSLAIDLGKAIEQETEKMRLASAMAQTLTDRLKFGMISGADEIKLANEKLIKQREVAEDAAKAIADLNGKLNELKFGNIEDDIAAGLAKEGRIPESKNVKKTVTTTQENVIKYDSYGDLDAALQRENANIAAIDGARNVTKSLEQELQLRRQVSDIYRSAELGADASMFEQEMAMVSARAAEETVIAQTRATEEMAQRSERLSQLLANDQLENTTRDQLRTQHDEQTKLAAQLLQEELNAIDERAANERIRIAEIERQSKIQLWGDMASSGIALLQAFGSKSQKSQKLFARASIIADTAQGIAKGVSLGWPAAVPAIAFAVAGGKRAMDALNSSSMPSGGGSSLSSAPAATSAPSTSTTTQSSFVIRLEGLDAIPDDAILSGRFVKQIGEKLEQLSADGVRI